MLLIVILEIKIESTANICNFDDNVDKALPWFPFGSQFSLDIDNFIHFFLAFLLQKIDSIDDGFLTRVVKIHLNPVLNIEDKRKFIGVKQIYHFCYVFFNRLFKRKIQLVKRWIEKRGQLMLDKFVSILQLLTFFRKHADNELIDRCRYIFLTWAVYLRADSAQKRLISTFDAAHNIFYDRLDSCHWLTIEGL